MKTFSAFILLTFFNMHVSFAGQPPENEQKIIRNFLTYITAPKWSIDTVVSKYVVFYSEESKVASRAKRKFYLSMAVTELAQAAKNVKINELKITPYDDADEKLQIMVLGPEYRERSFVVTDSSGKFVRYFLIKDDQIESFVLFQNKAYLLLN
ncbi:hypothetical protein [Chitinophaga alhagiae]|uniref:hypothetical protein n=1 Tax=Chitinophaga alhagiae TaxID=2203219 RepID=UPI000E5AA7A5|nr:hypothetical protein [Chitinophaga alhagiae]